MTENSCEGIDVECPNCGSDNYSVSHEEHDAGWVYCDFMCEECAYKFSVGFRAVSIEGTEHIQ